MPEPNDTLSEPPMTAGEDVTSIRWEPVGQDGSGEVTIEHVCKDPLIASLDLDAARRLVDRLLGPDKVEHSFPGDCFRWDRRSLVARLSA
jgi:hypothetical protein